MARTAYLDGWLYRLDFSSGKSYIGITFVSPEARYRGHAKQSRRGNMAIVYKAWRKYGAPILVTLTRLRADELIATEARAIKSFNTLQPGGYNMLPGGDVLPFQVPSILARMRVVSARMGAAGKGIAKTKEHRLRIGEANRGKRKNFGSNHCMRRSDVRAKSSESLKAKWAERKFNSIAFGAALWPK